MPIQPTRRYVPFISAGPQARRRPAPNIPSSVAAIVRGALTHHAQSRMGLRKISRDAVAATLAFGEGQASHGLSMCAVDRRAVDRASRIGIDLSAVEGVHVICAPCGAVVTTYRDRSLRGLSRARRQRDVGTRRHRRLPVRRPFPTQH